MKTYFQPPLALWKTHLLVCLIGWPLSAVLTYMVGNYGFSLFVVLPLVMGFLHALLFLPGRNISFRRAVRIWGIGLLICMAGMLLFAMEGLICLLMVAPLAWGVGILGVGLAMEIHHRRSHYGKPLLWLLVGCIGITAFVEMDATPQLRQVTTSVTIEATPQEVWDVVVAFPPLGEPTNGLFRMGVAYPTHAELEGRGVGAVRRCYFTTGAFVEPITEWDEPRKLSFVVEEYPEPMTELSFHEVDAPHLHDYFVSQRGQFELRELPDGSTELLGTTWYYHKIRPAIYWQLWSEYLLHTIHNRVLSHVKVYAEKTHERAQPG